MGPARPGVFEFWLWAGPCRTAKPSMGRRFWGFVQLCTRPIYEGPKPFWTLFWKFQIFHPGVRSRDLWLGNPMLSPLYWAANGCSARGPGPGPKASALLGHAEADRSPSQGANDMWKVKYRQNPNITLKWISYVRADPSHPHHWFIHEPMLYENSNKSTRAW